MTSTASAQSNAVKEPAVIGYPNEKGVTIERVTYPARNMGTTIVGSLFKPAGFDANRKYPAIVQSRRGAPRGDGQPVLRRADEAAETGRRGTFINHLELLCHTRKRGRSGRGEVHRWSVTRGQPRISPGSSLKEFRHQVCDLQIIQVGQGEVGVAANAHFRQMHKGDIAAMAVTASRHCPAIARRTRHCPGRDSRSAFGDVVAEVDDDRNLRELHELRRRHADALSVCRRAGMGAALRPRGR